MYSLLYDTLQHFPPGQPAKPLPTGSFITFINQTGPAIVFAVNSETGVVYQEAFEPARHWLLSLIVIFALIFPLLVSIFITTSLIVRYKGFLDEHRQEKLREELLMRDGLIGNLDIQDKAEELQAKREELERAVRDETTPEADRKAFEKLLQDVKAKQHLHTLKAQEKRPVTTAMWQTCVAETGFFNIYEELEGDTTARSMTGELFLVVREVILALGPSALPLFAASLIQKALLDSKCDLATDVCACYSSPPPLVAPVTTIVMVYWIVCGVELCFHYLGLRYSMTQQIVRHVFYPLYITFLWVTLFIISTLCTWIVLGVLLFTLKMLPYAAAMLGLLSVGLLKHHTSTAFRERLDRRLWDRTTNSKRARQLRVLVQIELYDLVIRRRIQQALTNARQTAPLTAASVLLTVFLLGLLYGTLFVGFTAFSDPTDPAAGLLNSAILVALTAMAVQYSRATDTSESDELISEAERTIFLRVDQTLRTMCRLAIHARRVRSAHLRLAGISESTSGEDSDGDAEDSPGQSSDNDSW
jgi:uncharacterized membrane protein